MAKGKQYHPYMQPRIHSYENRLFLAQSKVILDFLKKSVLKWVNRGEDEHWIFIQEGKPSPKKQAPWMPKLYVCVQPQDYWTVVADLIFISHKYKFAWKFCKNFKTFARPDKIVIYGTDVADLKRIIKLVRPLLNGKGSHKLSHAADTVQTGLEKKGRGIFVGCDPTFIEKMSWRYYRWILQETVIKPNSKNGRLDKNTAAALKVLNVSLKHQGPLKLMPDKKNIKFIKELWKEINS